MPGGGRQHVIRVRVFHEFPRYAGMTDAEAFTQSFGQVDAAERWGLDVIWIAELHFLPERSVASAPLLIASAIASRTNRMKIGIAVQVLPLCHPLRLAEEVATLDHISHGRLVFGSAQFDARRGGYLDPDRRGDRTEERDAIEAILGDSLARPR